MEKKFKKGDICWCSFHDEFIKILGDSDFFEQSYKYKFITNVPYKGARLTHASSNWLTLIDSKLVRILFEEGI